MTSRHVMVWPITDPEMTTRAIRNQAMNDLALEAARLNVSLTEPRFTIADDVLVCECVAEETASSAMSVFEPYLPLDVVIRDGLGERGGHLPPERDEARRRIAAFAGTAEQLAEVACVSSRTIQRITSETGAV